MGEFYRQCRIWHGYLSAFAFLALMFFSVTGILLNHPEWFERPGAETKPVTVNLSPAEIAGVAAASDQPREIARIVRARTPVLGAFKSGDVADGEALVRLEGVRGATDIAVDLATGEAEVTVERADAVTTLNELHRGKNSGEAWKWVIDLSGLIVLVLSLIGYVLFFSLRFRLKTSLILTAASLATMAGVFVFLVP